MEFYRNLPDFFFAMGSLTCAHLQHEVSQFYFFFFPLFFQLVLTKPTTPKLEGEGKGWLPEVGFEPTAFQSWVQRLHISATLPSDEQAYWGKAHNYIQLCKTLAADRKWCFGGNPETVSICTASLEIFGGLANRTWCTELESLRICDIKMGILKQTDSLMNWLGECKWPTGP